MILIRSKFDNVNSKALKKFGLSRYKASIYFTVQYVYYSVVQLGECLGGLHWRNGVESWFCIEIHSWVAF